MKLREVIEYIIRTGATGHEVDLAVQTFAPNITNSLPFIPIELPNYHQIEVMLRHANNTHIYCENSMFHFNAYYEFTDNCPLPRIYFVNETDLFKAASYFHYFESKNIKLPFISDNELSKILDEKNMQKRITKYQTTFDEKTKDFKRLHKGRQKNTTVDKSIYLHSDTCLACRKNTAVCLNTSTFGYNSGTMLGINLCETCLREASNASSLIEYITSKLDIQSPVKTSAISKYEILKFGINILKEKLNCQEIQINKEKSTITGRRKSGTKIILRLTSIHDYAYMVFDSNNKQIGRFDSANHHNVDFGPSHFHYDLPNNNKVEPSYMTGVPLFDITGLKNFIISKESRQQTN